MKHESLILLCLWNDFTLDNPSSDLIWTTKIALSQVALKFPCRVSSTKEITVLSCVEPGMRPVLGAG